MRIAVWPSLGQPWADVFEVARHADATGWDGVFLWDHLHLSRAARYDFVDQWVVLGAVAQASERVRLGSLVSIRTTSSKISSPSDGFVPEQSSSRMTMAPFGSRSNSARMRTSSVPSRPSAWSARVS